MPRRIRDRADAVACLAAVDASGLQRADWARRQDVDARSLNAWRLNLAREGRGGVRLVELVPTPTARPARYLVRLDGLEVELDDQFREDTLARLLGVLSRC